MRRSSIQHLYSEPAARSTSPASGPDRARKTMRLSKMQALPWGPRRASPRRGSLRLGHAAAERRLGAVEQDSHVLGREAEGARHALARDLVEHAQRHHGALDLAQGGDAMAE